MRRIQLLRRMLLFVMAVSSPVWADSTELVPARSHSLTTRLVTEVIDRFHYRKTSINDELSAAILDRYIKQLDPNRSIFTQQDIDTFAEYKTRMDDTLRSGELDPAFDIFRVYRMQLQNRMQYAIKLLDQQFTFDVDENYQTDRSKEDWAADSGELNEIWRKRVKNDVLGLRLAGKTASQATETLTKRYERLHRVANQLQAIDVYEMFLNACLQSVDPHTSYFSPRASENFNIHMSLSLEGIGARLRTENEHTIVVSVIPGGPADMSDQLHADDRIIGVGQGDNEMVDVVGWRIMDVVDLIRGPKHTNVRLQILPANVSAEGPGKIITLVRDKIKLEEQAAKKSIIERRVGEDTVRIAVIDIPTFYLDFAARTRGDKNYRSTTRDVRRLLKEIKAEKVDGLVVDLRGNSGGSLLEASSLTGLFINTGPVVQILKASGKVDVIDDPDPDLVYSGPVAVLVDRRSASASEIFAGAIQDYQRGVIVGEPTFGKGTVQNVTDLNRFTRNPAAELGKLKFTSAQFFRISGDSTQYRGVIPDIVFPTVLDSTSHGERALENALPWSRIEAAEYKPYVPALGKYTSIKQRHEKRVKTDAGFAFLLHKLENFRKARKNTTISLLETRRKSERDKNKIASREKENLYRITQGLKPLPDGDKPKKEDNTKTEGILLNEAAQILAELISMQHTHTVLHRE